MYRMMQLWPVLMIIDPDGIALVWRISCLFRHLEKPVILARKF